jgi:hypothetical protein
LNRTNTRRSWISFCDLSKETGNPGPDSEQMRGKETLDMPVNKARRELYYVPVLE